MAGRRLPESGLPEPGLPESGLPESGLPDPIPRPEQWRDGDAAPWAGISGAPTAAQVAAAVGARLTPLPHVPSFTSSRESAVIVALTDGARGAEVLLTKRSMHLSSHRGQMSFPGGRVEPGETFEAAALREAHEEVGLMPGDVALAGRLDPLSTAVSRSFIVPVVGVVSARPQLLAHPGEVDRIVWVPLADLVRDDIYREEWWGTPPFDRPMFFFELFDEVIWGATARMLHQLLRVAHGLNTPEPPAW